VTRKDLEGLLSEHTQTILSAMDMRFNKMEAHFDRRIDNVRDDLRIDINNIQTLIDGYVKAQEDYKQEFEIMKKEHDLMKKIIKEKLGLEIKLA
jgi:hypothetical protein